jgi:hypothetical protein
MSIFECAWHPEQAAALASIMTDLQLEVFSLRKAEPALQGLLGQVLLLYRAARRPDWHVVTSLLAAVGHMRQVVLVTPRRGVQSKQ